MKYDNITEGIFRKRPNRFIAHVDVAGEEMICHVKNTGRCRELFIPGTPVGLVASDNPNRKTKYDLVSVKKQDRWVNMDSQMANDVAGEWLQTGRLFSQNASIYRERRYGNSRFDFYIEDENRKIFLEVKSVTLEDGGIARFPDAPTVRGIKHIEELCACLQEGYEAYILFVIQMKGIKKFMPNWKTHREFGEALCAAKEKGVKILAVDCAVTMGSITAEHCIDVVLDEM